MIQHGWDLSPPSMLPFVVRLLFNDPNTSVIINTLECFYNSIIDFIARYGIKAKLHRPEIKLKFHQCSRITVWRIVNGHGHIIDRSALQFHPMPIIGNESLFDWLLRVILFINLLMKLYLFSLRYLFIYSHREALSVFIHKLIKPFKVMLDLSMAEVFMHSWISTSIAALAFSKVL